MTFLDAVLLTGSSFYYILLVKQYTFTKANLYFFAPFYCSGQLIHCLEISGNKNLRGI